MKKFRVGFMRKIGRLPPVAIMYAFIVHYAPKIIEVKTQLNTTKIKLPVIIHISPP